jgi:adenylate cyclase
MNAVQSFFSNMVNKIKSELLHSLRLFIEFITILLTGIRAKLALFTGSLISITVLTLSLITVQQQTEILTESYDKQATISRKYISFLVTELDNISQNLIQIEAFKSQIEKQSTIRKKYQTARTFNVDKKVSMFGVQTNLFGAFGKQRIRRQYDTFYSRYLSKEDVKLLEEKTREQLDIASGGNVTDRDWKNLLQLASQYANLETILASEENPDPKQQAKLVLVKGKLDNSIADLIIQSKKKNIEDLGLDTEKFRMQIFPSSIIESEGELSPSFDTKIFNQESDLANLPNDEVLDDSLRTAFGEVFSKVKVDVSENTVSVNWKDYDIQAIYSPLYRNPDSTTWAQHLTNLESDQEAFQELLQIDQEVSKKVSELYPKIQERLEELKTKKPPIPPYKDKLFNSLYREYNAATGLRETALADLETKLSDSEKVRKTLQAIRTIRNSYIEDAILLRYKPDGSSVDRYLSSEEDKKLQDNRWRLLRLWIQAGKIETPPEFLKRLFAEGTIAKSRSEAEEIMWKIDSLPIYNSETNEALSAIVLRKNLAGMIRTLVDRTEGIKSIRENRDKAIWTSMIIGFLSIFAAIIFSGVVVRKIRNIIHRAEDVGRGNLNVEFEHGGNDEFGKLTVALNSMVSGLKEREKIKGILGSMIDPVVVQEAMKDLQALKRGKETEITAFFSDIASFSMISEKLTSPELADLLNEYLSAMTLILKKHEGVLDKYIGDAIVGIFNSPIEVTDHVYKACVASIEMKEKLEELKARWKKENKYIPEAREMTFRIGLNTGLAKVGFMGTDALASYTMMGDTVNLAARLEAAAKDYGVTVLASESIASLVKDRIVTRELDSVRVKGKSQPVKLFEIIAKRENASENLLNAIQIYEEGLHSYYYQDWKIASRKFKSAAEHHPEFEKSCKLLLARSKHYEQNPPPQDWDGVYTRNTK